jgi:hypothetical protein
MHFWSAPDAPHSGGASVGGKIDKPFQSRFARFGASRLSCSHVDWDAAIWLSEAFADLLRVMPRDLGRNTGDEQDIAWTRKLAMCPA